MGTFWPSFADFERYAAEASVVPVWRELLADSLTPVTAWATIGGEPGSFLLESVEHGEKWGRYSFVGFRPSLRVRGKKDRFELVEGDRIEVQATSDPWGALRELMRSWRGPSHVPGLPRFWGGAVGYVSYDAVRLFEPAVGERLPEEPNAWDFSFAIGGIVVIFDDLDQTARIVRLVRVDRAGDLRVAYEAARDEIEAVAARLAAPRQPRLMERPRVGFEGALPPSTFDKQSFVSAVEVAKEHIRAGDIFQVVLSQRFTTQAEGVDLFDVYRALRTINPSPYMYFLRFPEVTIAGASPETLVRLVDGRAEVRPIAGTRRRGASDEDDARIAQELLADPKERAEHVMLVDLGRNDLGRVCEPGTVKLTEQMAVERYSHVMHIVSNVEGVLAKDKDAIDLLRATFPAGTLSGAPKVRAMQILDELEPVRRGIYGGAVGYLGLDGNMDMAIAIRTVIAKDGEIRVQAGAGLVEASDPVAEHEETVNKARAALGAVQSVRR